MCLCDKCMNQKMSVSVPSYIINNKDRITLFTSSLKRNKKFCGKGVNADIEINDCEYFSEVLAISTIPEMVRVKAT